MNYTLKIKKEINITSQDLEDIISCGLTYEWFQLDNTTSEWKLQKEELKKKYQDDKVYIEKIAVSCLENGIEVVIGEDEDEDGSYSKRHVLTLEKLLEGIKTACREGYWSGDMDDLDSDYGDAIIQCALLGDVVYG